MICSFGLCFFKGYKGYGLALKLAKIIILTGPGGTGKSTASEALKGMLPSYASQTLELRHLSGRFETSAMAGKKILAFSDELLESFGKEKGLKTLADMNRISGEKVMRGEIKHQSHIPIMIEGQVILNTNSVFATPQLELYSAIKRRYAVFPFLSFRQGAKEDFVETLKEDLTKLKIIFTRSESLIPQITGVLKKFDLEDALLEHKDYKHYEMYTDPFNSFFREGLEEDPNGIMPMNQLYTHMINYLKDRKGSLLEIHNIMEYEKSMKESLERPDK